MTYRELLKLYKQGKLEDSAKKQVEAEIEKQDAISEFLYEEGTIPDFSDLESENAGKLENKKCLTGQQNDQEDELNSQFIKQIQHSIRRAFIKMGLAVGAAVLAVVLCAVFILPKAGVVLADGILCFMTMPQIFRNSKNVLSLGISVVLLIVLLQKDLVKNPEFSSGYVTNGAITCLTNIIRENEDETWTIVSANDETQMGLDHGWHFETITFLRQLEKIDEDTKILIPTKNIYFFIEKIPLDYSVSYAGSGQSISKKGASQTLPNVGGIGMYQGEKRWIVMSRMYYWVQAFMKKYPNEMKVYYEDDQFICYRIPQNMYHQYNFAIDYGYNQVETEEQEAEQ